MTAKYSTPTCIIFFLGFFIFSVGCTGTTHTDYDKLCQIYADIVPQPLELSMKEGKIAESVLKALPKFFKDNFVHIIQGNADLRYSFIKQLAEAETKMQWDCAVMRSYYAEEFNISQ